MDNFRPVYKLPFLGNGCGKRDSLEAPEGLYTNLRSVPEKGVGEKDQLLSSRKVESLIVSE